MKKIIYFIPLTFLLLVGCGSKSFEASDMIYQESITTNGFASEMDFGFNIGQSSSNKGDIKDSNVYEDSKVEYVEEGNINNIDNNIYSQKLIRNVDISFETEKFQDAINSIKHLTVQYGGYIENSRFYDNYNYDTQNFIVRIPFNNVDVFLGFINENSDFTISSISDRVNDVTLQYYDMDAKVKSLEIEQESLNNILAKATEMKDIISLHDRLENIRYELSNYQTSLKVMENQITYSTININIIGRDYVSKIDDDQNMFERIKNGFNDNLYDIKIFLEDLIVYIASNILTIVFFALIIFVAIIVIKKKRNKRQQNNSENFEKSKK